MALHGTPKHPVAHHGTPWHPVALPGIPRHPVAHFGTPWHPVASARSLDASGSRGSQRLIAEMDHPALLVDSLLQGAVGLGGSVVAPKLRAGHEKTVFSNCEVGN